MLQGLVRSEVVKRVNFAALLQNKLHVFVVIPSAWYILTALWKRKGQGDSATPKFPLPKAHHADLQVPASYVKGNRFCCSRMKQQNRTAKAG